MKTRSFLLFLTIVFVAAAGYAQKCELTDKVVDCWKRFNPQAGSPVTEADIQTDEQRIKSTVSAANTGLSSLVSPSASSVKDFLSLLSASMESKSLTSDGQSATFDFNPPITILGADHALKLQAAFAKPKLNDQLTTHFASDTAAVKPFNDALGDDDDVAISGTFQPTSERWGRSLVPHREMFEGMMNALAPDDTVWLLALSDVLTETGVDSQNRTFQSFGPNGPAIKQAVEEAAKQQQQLLRVTGGFAHAFAQLLNNQPQLYATALFNARKNVVGPNEWTAKLTYERGANDLNAFRQKHGNTCSQAGLAREQQAACAKIIQDLARAGSDDGRLTLSLEYHRTNRRWIKGDTNLGGFEFGYSRAHNFAYEVKYGRTMMGKMIDTNSGRIDLSFKYEDVRDPTDATKNVRSRGVGAITYTQKINDNFSLPLSLLYANHASDLGDVDKKFNAHFGIVYKLPSGK